MITFLSQGRKVLLHVLWCSAIIFVHQSMSWLLRNYVVMIKVPTLSNCLLFQREETVPGSQFLGSTNFTWCHERRIWSKFRRADVKRHHDIEGIINGIILQEGWRASWEPTQLLCWGCLNFAGRLFPLEQIVGPNKSKQTEWNQFSANCPQERPRVDNFATWYPHPKLKCSKEHCLSYCVHCQSEQQTVTHTQNTQCTFTRS